jgi:hypothetical protein
LSLNIPGTEAITLHNHEVFKQLVYTSGRCETLVITAQVQATQDRRINWPQRERKNINLHIGNLHNPMVNQMKTLLIVMTAIFFTVWSHARAGTVLPNNVDTNGNFHCSVE